MGEFYEVSGLEMREMNQISLETFSLSKENMFESSADIVIEKINKEKLLK